MSDQLLLFGAEHWEDWPSQPGWYWVQTPSGGLSIHEAVDREGEIKVSVPFYMVGQKGGESKRGARWYWGKDVKFLAIQQPRTNPQK